VPHRTGVDHIALTVTDLDVSERRFAEVLGLLPALDVGAGRVLLRQREAPDEAVPALASPMLGPDVVARR
jgi:catechol 2,3-dioxygenase-like lactoylglutathione lyase family enzyme